ncbi:MAG: Gfo/Idh/MocA family oxidoreductase [Phycisphaeraceae bacterium]|nr:Gfo/Idh/MocA family oxidoreductase [Phycisphaerales bacterium]MCB9860131.1 Gfo/Idh/MocA family oxidoreductase [Phycisphaeraceae bacterium]
MSDATSADRFGGRKLRCAAVGVGRMGRHHARVYSQLSHVDLVGVLDANVEQCEYMAEQYNTKALRSLDELLDMDVDAVSIAVPTIYHKDTAVPLLNKGVACLIEKPLAQDAQTASIIKAAADKSGAVLMVGHIERFNPIMRAMQRATAGGSDIRARFIQVHRVSPMTFRSVDIGVVMDMMIHDLDVVLMLMGGQEPSSIKAAGVAVLTDNEDMCQAWLEFDRPYGKCVANLSASRLALKTDRVARIHGDTGYIKIDYAAKTGQIIRRTANEIQLREVADQLREGADLTDMKWDQLVNVEELQIDSGEPIVTEIEEFLDAVRTGRRPSVDAEAGLVNVRTAERIVEAIREVQPTRVD